MTADVPERPPHHDEKNTAAEVGAPEPLTVTNESENGRKLVSGSKADGEAEEDEDGKAAEAPATGQEVVSPRVDVKMMDLQTDERRPDGGGIEEEEDAMEVKDEDEDMADVKDAEDPLKTEPEALQTAEQPRSGPDDDASTAENPLLMEAAVDTAADPKHEPPRTPPETPQVDGGVENMVGAVDVMAVPPPQDISVSLGLSHLAVAHGLSEVPPEVVAMQLGGDVDLVADPSFHGAEMVRSATYPLSGIDSIHNGISDADMHAALAQLDFPAVEVPETPVRHVNGDNAMGMSALQAFSPPNIPVEPPEESRIIAYAMLRFDYGYDFYMKDYNLILGREDHSQQQRLQKQLELHDEHQNEFGPSATLSTQAQINMDSLSPGLAALDTPLLGKKKKSKKSGGSSSHRSGSRKGRSSSSSHKTNNGNTDTTMTISNDQPDAEEDPYANELFLKIKHPDGRSLNNISRRHARIAYNFETRNFELQVLGKNGAFVDEHHYRTGTVAPLDNNTKVQIGRVVFHFLLPISDEDNDTAMNDAGNEGNINGAAGGKEKSRGKSNGEHRMSLSFHDEKGVELPPDSFDDDAVESSSSSLTPVGSDDLESDEVEEEEAEEEAGGDEDEEGEEDEEVLEDEEDMRYNSESGDELGDGDDEGGDKNGRDQVRAKGKEKRVGGKRGQKGAKARKDTAAKKTAVKKPRGRPPKEKPVKEKRPRGRRPEPEKAKRREQEKIAERESALAKAREKEKERELREKAREEERKERQQAKLLAQEEKKLRKQRKEEEKARAHKEKEERKQQQRLEKEARMKESKEAKQQQQHQEEIRPPKLPKGKKKKKKRSPSPPINEAELPPEKLLKPTVPYSVMIFDAIMNSETRKLSLPDLYRSIERSYPWFKLRAATSGWQSSVRHNLRGCPDLFYTVQKEGKGYLWGVKDGANVDKERKKRRGISSPPPLPHPANAGYQGVPAQSQYGGQSANTIPMGSSFQRPPNLQQPLQPVVARQAPPPLAPAPSALAATSQQQQVSAAGSAQQLLQNLAGQLSARPQAPVQPQKTVPQNSTNPGQSTAPGPAKQVPPSVAIKAPVGQSTAPQRTTIAPAATGVAPPASSVPQKRPANTAAVPQTRPPANRPGANTANLDSKAIAALNSFKEALTAQLANKSGGNKQSGPGASAATGAGGNAHIQNILQTLGVSSGGGSSNAATKVIFDVLKNVKSGAARPSAAGPSSSSNPRPPPAGKAPGQALPQKSHAVASAASTANRPQPPQPRSAAGTAGPQNAQQLMQMLAAIQRRAGGASATAQGQRQPAVPGTGGKGLAVNRSIPKSNISAPAPSIASTEGNKRQLEVESAVQPPAKRPAIQQQ